MIPEGPNMVGSLGQLKNSGLLARRSGGDFNSGKDRQFPKSHINQKKPGNGARWARATSPDYAQGRNLVESN